jgi:hypothetical protein
MQPNPLHEVPESTEDHEEETINLVFGRMLSDRGFRDFFEHEPEGAVASLKISLTSDGFAKLRGYLARLESASSGMRRAISAKVDAHERCKQR